MKIFTMKEQTPKTPKDAFKLAYRLARQPDRYFADNLIINFPLCYMLMALKSLENRK